MIGAVLLLLAALLAVPARAADPVPYSHTGIRRVPISLTFTGRSVFMFGELPPGTDDVAVVVEGPPSGRVALMKKGRVVVFWLGVRQYHLEHMPGLYVVSLHCPRCNCLAACVHPAALDSLNRALEPLGDVVGPEALARDTRVEARGGELEPGEKEDVLQGYWELEEDKGLFAVRQNAIRIGPGGRFYYLLDLPTQAPEGKYTVKSYFFESGKVVGVSVDEILVRKSGLVAWLSAAAARHGFLYGGLAVVIALASGYLAGTVFRRSAKH